MRIKVDASDLLKWARFYDDMPRMTKRALAKALNVFGEGVVNQTIRNIAEKNSWDPDVVRSRMMIHEADEHDLEFVMDATAVVAPSQDWQRPWDQRDSTAFEQDTLINIVTCDDECTCDLCRQIAADGPYPLSQVLEMQAKWADYVPPTPNLCPGTITNFIHPRCRCTSQPWSSYRRLNVAFQSESSRSSGSAPSHLMTMKQLARAVKDELITEIKIRKGSY